MFRILLAAILAIGLTNMATAQTAAPRNTDVQNVISAQIEAFQRDDFVTAFSYASPTIKGMFGNPDRFGLMVKNGFPMVWRPAQVDFLEQRTQEGAVFQRVLIKDQNGTFHALEYEMLPTPDGWQINSVQLIAPPAVAA